MIIQLYLVLSLVIFITSIIYTGYKDKDNTKPIDTIIACAVGIAMFWPVIVVVSLVGLVFVGITNTLLYVGRCLRG